MEIWKDIYNYEGYYQISNFGNIKSLSRLCKNNNGSFIKKETILKQNLINNYYGVRLSKDNVQTTKKIHRLLAEHFIENTLSLPQVNHKDGIKTNNSLSNLEWCDASYNQIHAIKHGLVPKTRNRKRQALPF